MNIYIKDALADTPEEALGHLSSTPDIVDSVSISGSRPTNQIVGVKLFSKLPSPAYTNEASPEVGNETILQTLHGVASASAVVLEISGPRLVCVNDRFTEEGGYSDPGDDADKDRDIDDPDFIELLLEGVPDCIRGGTVEWEVTAGAERVRLVSAPEAEQVGMLVSQEFDGAEPNADMKRIFVEGRKASEGIDDVVVTARVQIDGSEDNPRAFRNQTLKAEFKLTVTDLRWTGWAGDEDGSKTAERTEILVCDLDLRPAIRIDSPTASDEVLIGEPLVVKGAVRSMLDIVRNITVNGHAVPQSKIMFLEQSVVGMTAESVAEMTDRPPPYEVTFEYELSSSSSGYQRMVDSRLLTVEAFNNALPNPGRSRISLKIDTNLKPIYFEGTIIGWYDENRAAFTAPWPSDPAFTDVDMVEFFDGEQDSAFLYKTEVDHRAAGKGVVDCYGLAVAQSLGLYRRIKPLVFLDDYGQTVNNADAIQGPGIDLSYPIETGEPVEALYNNGQKEGVRMLFPVDIQVEDAESVVPGALEWSHGAFLVVGGSNGLLRVLNPEHADLPADAELTLSVSAFSESHANPFPEFSAGPWNISDNFAGLPDSFELEPVTNGVANVEIELRSPVYGLLGKDRVKVTVLPPIGLHPDRNRDRVIDGNDYSEETLERWPVYRYWMNNDRDRIGKSIMDSGDHLTSDEQGNAQSNMLIDGIRDLIDFFPVHIDIGELLEILDAAGIALDFRLRHDDAALNMATALCLEPAKAGHYQKDAGSALSVLNENQSWLSRISADGIVLTPSMLNRARAGNKLVLLFEGRSPTTTPLILDVLHPDGESILMSAELPLSITCITDMMMQRTIAGPGVTGGSEDAPNWPQEQTNDKLVIFVHGFHEDQESTIGHASAVFKRLYWSGSKAGYAWLRWPSDLRPGDNNHGGFWATLHYQLDVISALTKAPAFATTLTGLTGQWSEGVYVIAHSLGNMIASEAISLAPEGTVAGYAMLNAAVPVEAYAERPATNSFSGIAVEMVHRDWKPDYEPRLYMSEWWRLFDDNDPRLNLSWRGRFADVRQRTALFNFYSPTEDVFHLYPNSLTLAGFGVRNLFCGDDDLGRGSWQAQETWKGRNQISTHGYGGWSQTRWWGHRRRSGVYWRSRLPRAFPLRAQHANQIPTSELRTKPFFVRTTRHAPGGKEALLCIYKNHPDQPMQEYIDPYLAHLLARMVPAISPAAGQAPVPASGITNFDLMRQRDVPNWPRTNDDPKPWWHRDHRRVAYVYVHKLYDTIAKGTTNFKLDIME